MKITRNVDAWANKYSGIDLAQLKDPATLDLSGIFYTNNDLSAEGWSRIGTATITLQVLSPDAFLNAKADSLRAEITKAKADAARTIAILEDQLSKLLALPLDQTVDAS